MLLGFKGFLLESRDEDVWRSIEIAGDPMTQPEDLAILGQDPNGMVRMAVADNRSTSAETLFLLSQDRIGSVARKARKNPNFRDDPIGLLLADFNN